MNRPSLSEPVPAAQRAQQMGETLESLEGLAKTHFSRIPLLLHALMRFFAMLRSAMEKLAQQAADQALVVDAEPDAAVSGQALEAVGAEAVEAPCPRGARKRKWVRRAVRDAACVIAEPIAVRREVAWCDLFVLIGGVGCRPQSFQNFQNPLGQHRRLTPISLR